MQPYSPGPQSAGPMPGPTPPGSFQPGPPGYPPQFGPARQLDVTRFASAAVAVAGVVVLFCSLLDLYSISVNPGKVTDEVTGTVDVGIGFYSVVPFNAPVIALAIPILMLIAALTAIPGILGRTQGVLVSAVSALAATLIGLVMMFSNPLPDVELSGELARDAGDELQRELGVSTVEELIDRTSDIGPGTGLIIAVVFGVIASAAAGFVYWKSANTPATEPGAPSPMPIAQTPSATFPAPVGPHGPGAPQMPIAPGTPAPGGPAPAQAPPRQNPEPWDQTQISGPHDAGRHGNGETP